jgi:hypothetical protein
MDIGSRSRRFRLSFDRELTLIEQGVLGIAGSDEVGRGRFQYTEQAVGLGRAEIAFDCRRIDDR